MATSSGQAYVLSYLDSRYNTRQFISVRKPRFTMPIQPPDWTEFLICPICTQPFSTSFRPPTTLGCGHSICKNCLSTINKKCPFDKETMLKWEPEDLPFNYALLQLVTPASSSNDNAICQNIIRDISPAIIRSFSLDELECYKCAIKCIEELAVSLKPSGTISGLLSRPMQRRIVGLVGCQLLLDNGRLRSVRIARSLGGRAVTELILQHQNAQQLGSNLLAAVRARGCQFLGPAMQDEVLKFVLLALRDGASLSRKDLVMYVLHKLEKTFLQASKTCIGHVVQLLYRASCFKVTKRESDSSLMQLKEEFRTHKMLRREHDAQIIQIAVEAGLHIAPDQWSALLYGDTTHKSDMQSLIDQQLTPQSFSVSVEELMLALKRTADPANLSRLRADFNNLADIDPDLTVIPTMQECLTAIIAAKNVFNGLINFIQYHGQRKQQESTHVLNPNRYKISLCRDFSSRGSCPRGTNCTFAHSNEELERYRARMRKNTIRGAHPSNECDPSDYVAQSGPSHVAVNISHATKPNQEEVSLRFNKPMPYRNENALHQPLSANPQHLMPAYSGASSSSTPNLSTKLSPNQRKAIPSPMKNNVNSFRFNYNQPANNNDAYSASSVYDRAPPLSAPPITQHAPLFMSQEFKKQFTPYQNAPSAVPQKSNFQMIQALLNQGRSHDFNNNNGSADNKYMIDWNQNVNYLGGNVSHDNHLTASHNSVSQNGLPTSRSRQEMVRMDGNPNINRMSQPLNDKLIYRNSKNDEDDPWNFPSHVTNGNPPTYNLLEALKTRQQWSGLQSLPPKPCAAAAADMMGNSNYNAEMTKIPNDNRNSNDLYNGRSQNGQRGSFLDLPISDMQSTSIRPQIPSSTAAAVAKPNVWINPLQNWNELSKNTSEDPEQNWNKLSKGHH